GADVRLITCVSTSPPTPATKRTTRVGVTQLLLSGTPPTFDPSCCTPETGDQRSLCARPDTTWPGEAPRAAEISGLCRARPIRTATESVVRIHTRWLVDRHDVALR